MPEEGDWLHIPGFPGYGVSPAGAVRNGRGRVLSQTDPGNGGRRVRMGKAQPMVHDLVARAFYGKPPPGYRVVHLNGDRSDNRADNLAFRESWEKCPFGHALARDNVVVIDNLRGCLTCWLDVLDPGSPRWIEYFQSRKSECAPGPALPPSWLE